MRTCILLLCASALLVTLSVARTADGRQATLVTKEADALYAGREETANAQRAAEILAEAVRRDPSDFEAMWRLARVRCWIGDHAPEGERRRQYELGMEAANLAVAARPNRPEGHFWLGTSLGGLADLGMIAGIRYRNAVRQQFETTARLDPGFEAGSAFTALGDWYLRVPDFLGGDKKQAEELLRRALTYDPNSTVTRYFLAQTLLATNRRQEARTELQRVIDAPFDPDYTPEDKEWKRKARDLLATLKDR